MKNIAKNEIDGMRPELVLTGYINEFNNHFQTAADSMLSDISWKQLYVIRCISLFDQAPTINELGDFIGSSHQNTKQILRKLVKGGYAELKNDENDRRKVRVLLTGKAYKLYEDNADLRDGFINRLFDGISREEVESAVRMFRILEKNLDRYLIL